MESPAAVMDLVPSDKEKGLPTPIWNRYESLLPKADCKEALKMTERYEFKNVQKKKKRHPLSLQPGRWHPLATSSSGMELLTSDPLRDHSRLKIGCA